MKNRNVYKVWNVRELNLKRLIEEDKPISIELSSKPDNPDWINILKILLEYRKDLKLRVFGNMGEWTDLNFLNSLANLEHLEVDEDELHDISPLYSLQNVKSLSLGETLKSFSLKFLSKFKQLKYLNISKKKSDIEVISELKNLENIYLWDLSLNNLDLLNELKNLNRLSLNNTKLEKWDGLKPNSNLSYLELCHVKSHIDLSLINLFPSLNYLRICNIPNITEFPKLENCLTLGRISIDKMDQMKSLNNLKYIKSLEEIAVYGDTSNLQVEDFKFFEMLPKLKAAYIEFKSHDQNIKFRELINSFGIEFIQTKAPKFTEIRIPKWYKL